MLAGFTSSVAAARRCSATRAGAGLLLYFMILLRQNLRVHAYRSATFNGYWISASHTCPTAILAPLRQVQSASIKVLPSQIARGCHIQDMQGYHIHIVDGMATKLRKGSARRSTSSKSSIDAQTCGHNIWRKSSSELLFLRSTASDMLSPAQD